MDTIVLFYKKQTGTVIPADYVDWAVYMLEQDRFSPSLAILSSLRPPLNLFEVESYFERSIKELSIAEPSYMDCGYRYIQYLARRIMEDKENAIDYALDIYEAACRLDYPQELNEWLDLGEEVEDYRSREQQTELSKAFLIISIRREAKHYLRRQMVYSQQEKG